MATHRCFCFLACLASITMAAQADVLVQPEGLDYFVVEAEDFEFDEFELDPVYVPNRDDDGFVVVTTADPEEFFDQDGEIFDLLPEDANVSGGAAIFDQLPGYGFTDSIVWRLQFSTPGEYFLYFHYSVFEVWNIADNGYGNEDSFFLGLEWDAPAEQAGRSNLDTFGAVPFDGTFDGNFQWMRATWEDGSSAKYPVSDADLGTVLDLNLATREHGSALDALIFSTDRRLTARDLDDILFGPELIPGDFDGDGALTRLDIDDLTVQSASGTNPLAYDLNGDAIVDEGDITVWVKDLRNTWFGDANLDGQFKTDDLIVVLAAGTFNADVDSVWSTGDFNGNGRFNSSDLVKSLADGGFNLGPRAATAAVPEPTTLTLLLCCALVVPLRRRVC